jgi:transcriptional regulator with XRE-family HTH domain
MTEKPRPRTADEVLEDHLRNPEFREQWERYTPARTVANSLIRYRAEYNLSQTGLAKRLGVSQPAVAKWESGEHIPTWDTILLLSRKLGIALIFGTLPPEHQPGQPKSTPGLEVRTLPAYSTEPSASILPSDGLQVQLLDDLRRVIWEFQYAQVMPTVTGTHAFAAAALPQEREVVKV